LYLGYGHENTGVNGAKWDHATVNYDFGVAKLITGYGTGRDALGDSRRNLIVGFTAPAGPTGFLIGSYNQLKEAGVTVQSKVSLTTSMEPRIAATSSRHTARPSPCPAMPLCSAPSRSKGWNSRAICSRVRPVPLSRTLTCTRAPSRTDTCTVPYSRLNLTALL